MQKVTIYTRQGCPYCTRALAVLETKPVEIEQIDAGMDPARKQEMVTRASGARTFPQIFIGDTHIGGCDDLLALERKGQLDRML
jgi:glutaredoxin 3